MQAVFGIESGCDAKGMTYVYSVVSRRAGGVSIGVNLSPNSACNWRCVYCQVPGLSRGAPSAVDLGRLDHELRLMLGSVRLSSASLLTARIQDVAFSGNGEPTLSSMFAPAVATVRKVLREMQLSGVVKLRLITNGSRVLHSEVQEGLRHIAAQQGEVWFKVDGGSQAAIRRINDVWLSPENVSHRLAVCAGHAPTWVQTCVFAFDGIAPDEVWLRDYLAVLNAAGPRKLEGVLLYGLARPSMQVEASRLSRLSAGAIADIASAIRRTGLTVQVSP